MRGLDGRGVKANAIEDASSARAGASYCADLKGFICQAVRGNDKKTLLECGGQKTVCGNNGRPVPTLLESICRKKARRSGPCCEAD